jgi:predicted phage tail protein
VAAQDGPQDQGQDQSIARLIKGLVDDATTLARQEALLARQEIVEGMVASAKAGSFLAVAGVLALYGLGFALTAAAWAIGGPAWVGFLIIGGGLLLIAGVVGLIGQRRLARSKLAPERARAELRETATELRKEIKWARPRRTPPVKSS